MLDRLVEQIAVEAGRPVVDEARCVHALSAVASCEACVEACPMRAWLLDDERLALDIHACDGCGLCVPACPEAAISIDPAPIRAVRMVGDAAFVACEKAAPHGPGVLACLHLLGLRELLRLYQDGVRRLILVRADCQRCHRGSVSRLPTALHRFAMLLADRGLPALQLVELDPAAWRKRLAEQCKREGGVDRRSFFARIRQGAASVAPSADGTAVAPGMLLPASGEPALQPYLPEIDVALCEGCDACIRLCPHGALGMNRSDDGPLAYEIHAERCTGCGLCEDVCAVGAIEILDMALSRPQRIVLAENQCRACGNHYHLPQGPASTARLCRICARTNHHQKLYQVLD